MSRYIPSHKNYLSLVLVLAASLSPLCANAWGKRGHAIVCETAALLVSEPNQTLRASHPALRNHSFDLSYYCNVPDLVWRKGDLNSIEGYNHFVDLEIFNRAFAAKNLDSAKIEAAFLLPRIEFNKQFSEIKNSAGRSYWRIRELHQALRETAKKLKASGSEAPHALELEWLIEAGAIGHYVGDLAQPLHVTENHDGDLTHQKGIHVFFETDLVDALYDGVGAPAHELSADVARVASELIKREHKSEPISEKPALYVDDWPIIRKLSQQSVDELPKLLKIDREVSRKSLEAAAKANRDLITARLAAGAVALAEIWRDSLDWKYNGRKFYDFAGAPEYIRAPDVLTAPESH